jgi:hypothetical protein
MNLSRYTSFLNELDTVSVENDFVDEVGAHNVVATASDSGTAAVSDAVNGVIVLTPSDGTVVDNDETYIEHPNEIFLFGANRRIYARHKFRYTAVVAADPSWAVGMVNAVGADTLVDTGGGVKVSGSTLAIEKRETETAFRCTSANNSASTTTLSNKSMAAATDYVTEIEVSERDGTTSTVCYKVDGEYLRDTNNNVIIHTITNASGTEMQLFAGIKLGAATNNDTLSVDYWYGAQTRV